MPMLRRLVVTGVYVSFRLIYLLIFRMFACFYGTANAARGSTTMLRAPGVCSVDTMTQHHRGEMVLGTIAPARHLETWQASQLPNDEKASSTLINGHSPHDL